MGRPPRTNAEYFYHSANFRNDRRIKSVRARLGVAGYGLVLMLMEALTDAENIQLSTDEIELELLAGDLGVSVTEIDSLLQISEKIGLFIRYENGFFTCPDLVKSLQPVFEKRNRAKTAFENKQKGVSATESTDSVTVNTQSKVKKSKVKDTKVSKKDSLADESASGSEDFTLTHKIKQAVQQINPDYYWNGKDGKPALELIDKLKHSYRSTRHKEPTDEEVVSSFNRLVDESYKLRDFYHFSDIPKLNENYNKLVTEIRNKANTGSQPPPFKANGHVLNELT